VSKESPTNVDRTRSGASSRPLKVSTVPSSAERRITALVHEFVLQVFLPRGDFWHAVRDLRVRWNVAAETRVPPINNTGVYLPPECDRSDSSGLKGTQESNPVALMRWREDLGALHDRFVPRKCRTDARDSVSQENWERCLSALVLYDPPETQLLEFADRVSLSPVALCPHCKGAGEVPRGSSLNKEEILRPSATRRLWSRRRSNTCATQKRYRRLWMRTGGA
jgi:hypothetical protein